MLKIRIGAKTPSALREINKTLVLDLIREAGPISRAELARMTGFSRSTISSIVQELDEDNLLRTVGTDSGHVGRRAVLYELNPGAGFVLGIDIGGTNVQYLVVDMKGTTIAVDRRPSPDATDANVFFNKVADDAEQLIHEATETSSGLKSIGIAVPGIVNPKTGVVLGATPNLPGLSGSRLGEWFAQRFEVPTGVENDVNAALLGEHRFGAARGHDNAFFLVVSTGVGGALMLNGSLYHGSAFGAGEIGYWLMETDHLNGNWQPRGCLETLISGRSVAAEATKLIGNGLSAKDVFDAARTGNDKARSVVHRVGRILGQTISNVYSLLDIDIVILGGGMMLSADLLIPEIKEAVQRHAPRRVIPAEPKIVPSSLTDEAGVYGAAQLAMSLATPAVSLLRQGGETP